MAPQLTIPDHDFCLLCNQYIIFIYNLTMIKKVTFYFMLSFMFSTIILVYTFSLSLCEQRRREIDHSCVHVSGAGPKKRFPRIPDNLPVPGPHIPERSESA